MKVYVDGKLPKSCEKCEFYERETELVGEWGMENHRHICKINGSLIQGICPLQSLADHDKQLRNGVVEEIKERLKKANLEIMSPIDLYSYTDNFLYQVEKVEE